MNGQWSLFSYDTERNVWYQEDDFRALGFGRVNDELFAVNERTGELVAMMGTMGEMEDDFTWEAEFGLFGTDWREKKYLSRFDLRMYLEEGGMARLEIQYDSSGVWEKMPEIRGRSRRSFVIPVIPRRCDHLRFRLIGTGEMRLYSLSRILEVSTDG